MVAPTKFIEVQNTKATKQRGWGLIRSSIRQQSQDGNSIFQRQKDSSESHDEDDIASDASDLKVLQVADGGDTGDNNIPNTKHIENNIKSVVRSQHDAGNLFSSTHELDITPLTKQSDPATEIEMSQKDVWNNDFSKNPKPDMDMMSCQDKVRNESDKNNKINVEGAISGMITTENGNKQLLSKDSSITFEKSARHQFERLDKENTDDLCEKGKKNKDGSKHRCVIPPHSDFLSYWSVFIGCLLLYVGAFVPFRVSYLGDLDGLLEGVEVFVDISFGIDIFLNFVTAYETSDGQIEYNLKKISTHYLKGYFLLDLIATVPFDKILESAFDFSVNGINKASRLTRLPRLMKILRVARLIKLIRLYRFKRWIREIQLNYNVHQGITRLINIIIVVLFATHLVGCLWHAIGINLDINEASEVCASYGDEGFSEHIGQGYGWVCREGMIMQGMGHKYVASLYWAFSTLTTVGYGDISARTVTEQSFSMIMMLLGVSWYAYVVGSMSTIIASFDRQNKIARMKMIQVNTFIRETKLPPHLGNRVRRYYEYAISKKKNGLFGYDADEIIQELSTTLRTDVILNVEADLIEKIPFFVGKSPTFVANTIQLLQPVIVQKGDFIIKEGSAADEMYFLIKGTAAVYYGTLKVKDLSEGSYFGEIGCILGGVRRAAILAVSMCELQSLSKQNLNMLLSQHPSVGEDLKLVARARMKVVKKSKSDSPSFIHPQKKQSALEASAHREQNAAKLEKMDFKATDKEFDTCSFLQTGVECLPRRLSLTSGQVVGTGTHIKIGERDIKEMNKLDVRQKSIDHNRTFIASEIQTSYHQNHQKQRNVIRKPSMKADEHKIGIKEARKVLSSLNTTDQEIICNFICNTVERKFSEFGNILLQNQTGREQVTKF